MKYLSISGFIFMFILSFNGPLKDSKQSGFNKIADYNEHVTQTILNVGNFSSWIRNDGQSAHDPNGAPGARYPRGTAVAIYQDGLIWGGYVEGDANPRVGGQTYKVGTQPGHIISEGVPSNPDDAKVYRIRRDWQSLSIGDPEIVMDAAEINMIDVQSVTVQMQQDVLDQYGYDWDNWPGDLGAPYYDINENGIWDDGTDEPGIANADQVIWFVINDLDEARVAALYGSDPIGLEVQITFWSYKGNVGDFGETIFQRYKIINKSGLQIDSMFVSRWSDPDIGTDTDDFAGCDTVLNMGYAYNGYANDDNYAAFGLVPAAVGYKMLQGPLVVGVSGQDLNKNGIDDAEDSGIFDMQYTEQGYINLAMTSFYYFPTGSPWGDPHTGFMEGTFQWYNMLNGYIPTTDLENPTPYITGSGPLQGTPTKFPLSGEPITSSGDIDGQGINFSPGSRRLGICTGPFTMLAGDTNEIVYALSGGIGESYLASITDLKHNSQNLQSLHNDLYKGTFSYVNVTAHVEFETPEITNIRFEGLNTYADDITLILSNQAGTPLYQIQLYDDGTHGDNISADGTWSYLWVTAPINYGLNVSANVELSGEIYTWDNLINSLTTSGPVRVARILVGTDNLNFDGIINPGESVRYTVEIENQSTTALSDLLVKQISFSHDPNIISIYPETSAKYIPWINALGSYSWAYNPQDVFYQFQVSNTHPGNDSVEIVFLINDNSNNKWLDTLSIFVAAALDTNVVFDLLAEHSSGPGFGQIGIRVVDKGQLTGNLYEINFSETVGDQILYSVINATTAQTLLNNQPYPDQNAHTSTPVDGFVVTRGTTVPQQMVDWDFSGELWVSGINRGFPLFFGGAGYGRDFYFGSTLLSDDQYFSVQLVFQDQADVDTNGYVSNGAVYRRDLGYAHAGTGQLPVAAYDISNPENPRRLNISFIEDINVGNANMIWDMGWDGFAFAVLGGREYIFIHASDYNGGVDYNNSNFAPSADVVWGIHPQLQGSRVYLEAPFTLNFYILPPVGAGDVFNFNSIIASIKTEELSFELLQNYPNPFNPTTHIEFTLPELSEVKLVIYSILGQKVKTLVNQKLSIGPHSISWHGDNNFGQKVSSGLYFYKIEAGDYVESKKMLLLK